MEREVTGGGGENEGPWHAVVGQHSPVLHCGEGLLVGDVIHEQEAHGSAVVGCGDGPVALLACCVLGKQRSVSWGPPAPSLTLQGPARGTGLPLSNPVGEEECCLHRPNLMGRHGPALTRSLIGGIPVCPHGPV